MPIHIEDFNFNTYHGWEDIWQLLTCGNFSTGKYNSMTVGWGNFGVIWGLPVAMVMVRPTRFTFEYMESYDTFTLCAFPRKYRKELAFFGSVSGRDTNKFEKSILTPVASSIVSAPIYEEAELSVECKKIYWEDINPSHFLHSKIQTYYKEKDYHRIYYGEMVYISGISAYCHPDTRDPPLRGTKIG